MVPEIVVEIVMDVREIKFCETLNIMLSCCLRESVCILKFILTQFNSFVMGTAMNIISTHLYETEKLKELLIFSSSFFIYIITTIIVHYFVAIFSVNVVETWLPWLK